MERTERLWPGGPRYIYDEQCFPPSTDSFLLGSFAAPRRDERVCDLGAGAGLLGLLLLHLPDGGESPDVRRAYFRDKE